MGWELFNSPLPLFANLWKRDGYFLPWTYIFYLLFLSLVQTLIILPGAFSLFSQWDPCLLSYSSNLNNAPKCSNMQIWSCCSPAKTLPIFPHGLPQKNPEALPYGIRTLIISQPHLSLCVLPSLGLSCCCLPWLRTCNSGLLTITTY